MFPAYRHTPIFDPERKRCPICHHSVYSLAGIHPQCAKRLDARTKQKGKVDDAAKGGGDVEFQEATQD